MRGVAQPNFWNDANPHLERAARLERFLALDPPNAELLHDLAQSYICIKQ
jgi:hypothetical protein